MELPDGIVAEFHVGDPEPLVHVTVQLVRNILAQEDSVKVIVLDGVVRSD
jgi:hypothetical protein